MGIPCTASELSELRRRGATIRGGARASADAGPRKRRQKYNGPKRVYELRIKGWMPTPLNRLLSVHWGRRSRLKRHDRDVINVQASLDRVELANGRRRVGLRITLPRRQRAPDPDSLWKVLLDALVHERLLVNDSAAWCELGIVEFVRGEKLETVIRLEDV